MLVPFNQSQHETLMPGLCMDFKEMDKKGLLDGIKDYQWFSVLDESIYFNTIKLPCKLFKEGFDPAVYVDESTNSLKDDALLKDILSDNATVADLHQVLGLHVLKVEDIKKEKTRAEKDPNKTSVIETAKATEDKTNEQEVYKKEEELFAEETEEQSTLSRKFKGETLSRKIKKQ